MKSINVYALSKKEIIDRFAIEYCPWCDKDQIIFAHGTTECPDCKHVIYPCSVCHDERGGCKVTEPCPYGGDIPDKNRVATNIPIILDEKEQAFIYKNL